MAENVTLAWPKLPFRVSRFSDGLDGEEHRLELNGTGCIGFLPLTRAIYFTEGHPRGSRGWRLLESFPDPGVSKKRSPNRSDSRPLKSICKGYKEPTGARIRPVLAPQDLNRFGITEDEALNVQIQLSVAKSLGWESLRLIFGIKLPCCLSGQCAGVICDKLGVKVSWGCFPLACQGDHFGWIKSRFQMWVSYLQQNKAALP